jgi:hypothetical protein
MLSPLDDPLRSMLFQVASLCATGLLISQRWNMVQSFRGALNSPARRRTVMIGF